MADLHEKVSGLSFASSSHNFKKKLFETFWKILGFEKSCTKLLSYSKAQNFRLFYYLKSNYENKSIEWSNAFKTIIFIMFYYSLIYLGPVIQIFCLQTFPGTKSHNYHISGDFSLFQLVLLLQEMLLKFTVISGLRKFQKILKNQGVI